MLIIYNLSLQIYFQFMRLVALFHPKAKLWVEGQLLVMNYELSSSQKQETFTKPLISNLSSLISQTAWFHCASLGEFEQGRPVIEAFRQKYPEYKIVLTFFSPSGYEVRKNYAGADLVMYLPLDTPKNVALFLDTIQPKIVFFVKYEFWRNYLTELKKRQISVVLFSAIFRPNQVFFKWYGGFYRNILGCFSHIFVQNEISKQLLETIQIKNVSIGGDTRFDRVWQIVQQVKEIPTAKVFKNNIPTLVVGSAWQSDMDVLIPFINQSQNLKFIIAPHEIKQEEIKKWQEAINLNSICFSESNSENILGNQVLIIDNVGMLSALYQYADFAYIGGGFGKGLHNILEAATFGIPILFGNQAYHKFQEAKDLIEQKGAFAVANTDELMGIIQKMPTIQKTAGKICADYVKSKIGATQQVMNWVLINKKL